MTKITFAKTQSNRWMKIALLSLPVILYLIIAERLSWKPRTLHHSCPIYTIAFSPDGRLLATGTGGATATRNFGEASLWDIQTRSLLRQLRGHGEHVLSVAFSPDSKTLTTASADWTINQWDSQTGRLLRTLTRKGHKLLDMALSGDGKTIAGGSQNWLIWLWDSQTKSDQRALPLGHPEAYAVAFSPDGKALASGTGNWRMYALSGEVQVFDIKAGIVKRTLRGHTAPVTSVTFAPDGRTLASSSSSNLAKYDEVLHDASDASGLGLTKGKGDNTIRLWNVQTGKLLRTLLGGGYDITSVAFAPDGKMLASGSDDKSVRLWDTRTGQLLRVLSGHTSGVTSVAFSPDSRTLASGSWDGTVRLWRVR
jgi:WD40 repeat protein